MIRNSITFIFIAFFLNGCFSEAQKQVIKENRVELGDIKINYYSDKSVTSLEVPPDLTQPSYENSFRLSEYAKDVNLNVVNLSNKEIEDNPKRKILSTPSDIKVIKQGQRRSLIIDKNAETVWNLSKQFLKETGFTIKVTNKKIGILETDYLENQRPDIPAQSMGWFRSALQSAIENVNYTLPTVDKYKIRIEPVNETSSQVFLSISSMAEVVVSRADEKDRRTMWQKAEKNIDLEIEMLYQLMLYLGSDSSEAREKIINAKEENITKVNIIDGLNGYAKLLFNLNLIDTWDNVSWAISELDIALEDKDIKEKAFYISVARTSDKGIMSKLFGEDAISQSFQLQLKQINENQTELYFNDISEVNEIETKQFSYEFLGKMQKLF